MTNVVRHAGARHCRVTLVWRQRQMSVEIVDEGCAGGRDVPGAAHAAGAGYGIQGMRERVALLYGTFDAGPQTGGGFRVAAVFPLPLDPPDRLELTGRPDPMVLTGLDDADRLAGSGSPSRPGEAAS
ncbi:sensor histidine kinase [Streptomyces sp. NBC_01296]|uniref:sensor histidine kinase n=1 Tax=Streptomyces sp. NBC_01296 TaxID=2903816 RepID=UPI002E1173FC|nr:hypothetical protein OG299_40535 [Streptomyces sp. NBC_01296]